MIVGSPYRKLAALRYRAFAVASNVRKRGNKDGTGVAYGNQ
jgi:hypothetical protein